MICIYLAANKNIDYANFVIKTLSIMMISDMPVGNNKKASFPKLLFLVTFFLSLLRKFQ